VDGCNQINSSMLHECITKGILTKPRKTDANASCTGQRGQSILPLACKDLFHFRSSPVGDAQGCPWICRFPQWPDNCNCPGASPNAVFLVGRGDAHGFLCGSRATIKRTCLPSSTGVRTPPSRCGVLAVSIPRREFFAIVALALLP
jgi:hypothetical protein